MEIADLTTDCYVMFRSILVPAPCPQHLVLGWGEMGQGTHLPAEEPSAFGVRFSCAELALAATLFLRYFQKAKQSDLLQVLPVGNSAVQRKSSTTWFVSSFLLSF